MILSRVAQEGLLKRWDLCCERNSYVKILGKKNNKYKSPQTGNELYGKISTMARALWLKRVLRSWQKPILIL